MSSSYEWCSAMISTLSVMEATPEKHYEKRLVRSQPLLDAFWRGLIGFISEVLPKSAFGQAIKYCLNQWCKLEVFMQDGRLELDNNQVNARSNPS